MEFIHEKIILGGHKVRKVQILYRYKLALGVDLDPQVDLSQFPKKNIFFYLFFFPLKLEFLSSIWGKKVVISVGEAADIRLHERRVFWPWLYS